MFNAKKLHTACFLISALGQSKLGSITPCFNNLSTRFLTSALYQAAYTAYGVQFMHPPSLEALNLHALVCIIFIYLSLYAINISIRQTFLFI